MKHKIVAKVLPLNKSRYQSVGRSVKNSWWCHRVIIHRMEGNLKFDTILHNGDPLTPSTVPGAQNLEIHHYLHRARCLSSDQLNLWTNWSIEILGKLELSS